MTRKKADATIVVKVVEAFTNRMKEAAEALKKGSERNYAITSASIKDDLCNYTFEISAGVGSGDVHNVKGQGLIEEDMREAFGQWTAHFTKLSTGEQWTVTDNIYPDMKLAEQQTKLF